MGTGWGGAPQGKKLFEVDTQGEKGRHPQLDTPKVKKKLGKLTPEVGTFSLFYLVTRAFVHSDSHSGSDAFSHDVKVAAPGYKIGSIACLFHTSSLSISLFTLSPALKMSLFGTFENVATQEANGCEAGSGG